MPDIKIDETRWSERGKAIRSGDRDAGEGAAGTASREREIAESKAQGHGNDAGTAPPADPAPPANPAPSAESAAPESAPAARRGRGRPRKDRMPPPPGSVVTVRLELPKALYGAISLHALNRGCSPAAIVLALVEKHIKPVTLPDDDML